MKKYIQGSAHGRFQIFHLGHLKYLLTAKQHCDFLWIGITQYNIHSLLPSPEDPHRQESIHNPLTFFERVELITNVLLDNGIKINEFNIIPFPIEHPQSLPGFLPTSIPIFTTINDSWNEYKIYILKEIGYKVISLWEDRNKVINGINIRNLILRGNDKWKTQVPEATIKIIEKYNIQDRIKSLPISTYFRQS